MSVLSDFLNIFRSSKRRVFISYDHSEDRRYQNMLRAWDANSAFDFEFERCSPTVAINSEQAVVVKASLTRMMKKADYLLVIVGEKTHDSKWVNWEIDRSKRKDVNLRLVAVKLNKYYKTPVGLLNAGASFAYSFNRTAIIEALNNA